PARPGARATPRAPPAGTSVSRNSPVPVPLQGRPSPGVPQAQPQGTRVMVPQVKNLSSAQAQAVLNSVGLQAVPHGQTAPPRRVMSFAPTGMVPKGTAVQLYMSSN